ncbi:MAG: 1,4-dihydroxy-2-naphthoate polyprenyltransferase [Actinobacteria bacterium]|nr:1,4-dihydroxy-2-naphthoate polyprenyltransferase [Actinomycetota bacterium]
MTARPPPTGPPPTGLRLWMAGARPRTLGASVAPVLVGTAVASRSGSVIAWRAGAALVVAVALQVGVNYANDYSDGVRGVDERRRGPLRLTASGLVPAAAVKRAALVAFAVGALAGIVLALAVDWRLILVGAACILAAGLYSGGPKPYASAGLGEVAVLVFFGFVATCGSAFVHHARLPGLAVAAALPVGLAACAILLANNLRDVESDRNAGKRTLAVRVGAPAARGLYAVCVGGAVLCSLALAPFAPGSLLALAAAPLAVTPVRTVLRPDSDTPALVGALIATARFQLVLSVLLAVGLWNW